ncbi:hypothetical protein HK405_002123, partial [Cladochytrium tenue]
MLWSAVSDQPVHAVVDAALAACFWLRLLCLVPNTAMIFYYEKYHAWVGFHRWALQDPTYNPAVRERARDIAASLKVVIPAAEVAFGKVQHLGLRPSLAYARRFPTCVFDWLAVPIAGLLFYVIPQFDAQLSHLFTNALVYTVAAKPTLPTSASISNTATAVTVNPAAELTRRKTPSADALPALSTVVVDVTAASVISRPPAPIRLPDRRPAVISTGTGSSDDLPSHLAAHRLHPHLRPRAASSTASGSAFSSDFGVDISAK